jgi:hypothetical protein
MVTFSETLLLLLLLLLTAVDAGLLPSRGAGGPLVITVSSGAESADASTGAAA